MLPRQGEVLLLVYVLFYDYKYIFPSLNTYHRGVQHTNVYYTYLMLGIGKSLYRFRLSFNISAVLWNWLSAELDSLELYEKDRVNS